MKKPKKQGPTAQEKALEEVSIATWNDYVERFQPAEAELARRAEFTEGEKLAARGMANAEAAAAFKGLTRDTMAAQLVSGADESSGRSKFAMAGNAEGEGRAKGEVTIVIAGNNPKFIDAVGSNEDGPVSEEQVDP